jgi:hypothetical protein
MHMQVRNGLAGRFLAVNDDSISTVNAELSRQLGRYQMEMAQQHLISRGNLGMGCDNLPRDDQDVDGSLGINIPKSQAPIIFVYDVGRDLTIDDLFE